MNTVCPSGGAASSAWLAMTPPPPGRFSITTGCFQVAETWSPSARARISPELPAARSHRHVEGDQILVHRRLLPIGHHAADVVARLRKVDAKMKRPWRVGSGGVHGVARRLGVEAAAAAFDQARMQAHIAQDLR